MSKIAFIALSEIRSPLIDARTSSNDVKFTELVESIKQHGVLEPPLIRPIEGGLYEIVFGSRRIQAANALSLGKIQCIVRNMTDEAAESARLAENLDREDMNPVDEARFIQRLIDKYNLTEYQVADRLHRTAAFVSQRLTLLNRDQTVRDLTEAGQISIGVAREILRIPDPLKRRDMARYAARDGFNVGTAKRYVNQALSDMGMGQPPIPEESTVLTAPPIQPVIVVYPCETCMRKFPIETLTIKRICNDCDSVIQTAIEKGIFVYDAEHGSEGNAAVEGGGSEPDTEPADDREAGSSA